MAADGHREKIRFDIEKKNSPVICVVHHLWVIIQFNSIHLFATKSTSIHQHINAFTVKWSEGLRNLKGLYIPIQIQFLYRNTTQVIAAAIKWGVDYISGLVYFTFWRHLDGILEIAARKSINDNLIPLQ